MEHATLTLTEIGPEPKTVVLGDETVIGRSARAGIRIDGDLVSREHARVYHEGGRWFVEDMGSRNGTLLNRVRITASELTGGDVIMIGYGKLTFSLPDDSGSNFQVSIIESEQPVHATVVSSQHDAVAEGLSMTVAVSYQDLVVANQRISTIVKISQRLGTLLDQGELLDEVISTLFELFEQADRGAVVLAEDDRYRVAATRGRSEDATHPVMQVSRQLLHMVRNEGRSVLSRDVGSDSRFADNQSLIGGAVRSIMCAPLQHDEAFLGAILLETESIERRFEVNELNLLQAIAAPFALCLRNAQLAVRMEQEAKVRTSLSRYLSPDVVQQLGVGNLAGSLGGEQAEGTVLFTDISGATELSERLAPELLIARLNRYLDAMLAVLFRWKATVDKFGGDAILAVWGAPVPNERHARSACAAALEMQSGLFELNEALERAGEPQIAMAVGMNSGRFVAGNIGGADRVEWTVIGDAVNLAQRVESLSFRGGVLASDDTLSAFREDAGGFTFEAVSVKGRQEPVRIHSVRALRTERGIVAAVPGTVEVEGAADGRFRAVIARVQDSGPTQRVTLRVAGRPGVGRKIVFRAVLPEHPAELTLSGKIVSASPLQDHEAGSSADVMVSLVDPALDDVLRAEGVRPAAVTLAEIQSHAGGQSRAAFGG